MPNRIVELSQSIADNTKIVDEYFTRNGMPTPSFEIDGPSRVAIPPTEPAFSALTSVLSATKELHDLMHGPTNMLMNISANDCMSLEAIYRFQIAQAVPVGQERSFEEISAATGLNVVDLRRLLRHAMCSFIFREPRPGYVAHTAASKLLAEDQLIQAFAGITVEEKFRGTARTIDALIKYDGAHDPRQTGFTLGHGTDTGFYDEMEAKPIRGQRFAGAMNQFASLLSLTPLIESFDWASFGKATMVDVGGAWGPVSVGLAQAYPDLTFIVQDLPPVVVDGPSKIPAELQKRITFMPYSILEEQTVKGADIYFFRAIFHNWPDEYCVKILRNQIPALKPGARVLINDQCLHEPGTLPAPMERRRSMLTFFGSRERTVADWEAMLKEADPRFHLRADIEPPGDMIHILDIEWRG